MGDEWGKMTEMPEYVLDNNQTGPDNEKSLPEILKKTDL